MFATYGGYTLNPQSSAGPHKPKVNPFLLSLSGELCCSLAGTWEISERQMWSGKVSGTKYDCVENKSLLPTPTALCLHLPPSRRSKIQGSPHTHHRGLKTHNSLFSNYMNIVWWDHQPGRHWLGSECVAAAGRPERRAACRATPRSGACGWAAQPEEGSRWRPSSPWSCWWPPIGRCWYVQVQASPAEGQHQERSSRTQF